ncbi:MAG: hypothetical protein APF81_14550 [Desulfosporosinus sp. BRH_c37]|nr:MAG: hypothetical protein APF81_14550 [Desulfosporosinus sp. BRH_c37]
MFDFHIILSLLSILIAWKWGDWRNWKLYYSTILYMILGDLTYIILSSNKPLWEYESRIISGDFAEFLTAIVVFPCTCLIYFELYSKVIKAKRIAYIPFLFLFSSSIYSAIEWLSFRMGAFSYHNGWNIWWSFGFNCIMFPLLLLHYKKPLLVWPISIAFAFLMINYFHLPFTIMK